MLMTQYERTSPGTGRGGDGSARDCAEGVGGEEDPARDKAISAWYVAGDRLKVMQSSS